jgi:hypothetical protein
LPVTSAEREILARYGAAEGFRVSTDLDTVARQYDTYGIQPEDIVPPTTPMGAAVRVKPHPDRAPVDPDWLDRAVTPSPEQKLNRGGFATLGDAARALDEDAFNTFEDLTRQLDEAKTDLSNAKAINAEKQAGVTTTLDRLIAQTRAALGAAKNARDKSALQARLVELAERREPVPKTIRAAEPIDTRTLEQRIASLPDQIDKASKLVRRALARADEAWELNQTQRDAVNEAIAKAVASPASSGQTFANVPQGTARVTANRTAGLPELAGEKPKPGENFTEVVDRAQDAKDKLLPKLTEDFKTSMKRILSNLDKLDQAKKAGVDTTEAEKKLDMRIAGTEVDIRDVLGIDMNGVSVRQALEDLANDDAALVEITRCRLR